MAFEPNPESFRCAQITIALNELQNIELRHAGLGSQNDSMLLQVHDEHGNALGGASQLLTDDTSSARLSAVEVEVLSLDDVLPVERPISIVQLDVEGFETFVLTGALDTIKRWNPILVLESTPEDSWLGKNILPLGYRRIGYVHANTIYATESRLPRTRLAGVTKVA